MKRRVNEGDDMTVAYYRIDDGGYPRNERIRAYLDAIGIRVIRHERARTGGAVRRLLADALDLWPLARRADAVVVSEMSLPIVPWAWIVSRLTRTLLVVDGFVGKYETVIVDRRLHSPDSLHARVLALVDRLSVSLSDVYLVDTRVRAAAIREAHPEALVLSLPVGAPEWALARPLEPTDGTLRLLFYGSYLPLHGVPTIIEALSRARSADVRLTMVGTSDHRSDVEQARELARSLGVADRIRFLPPVPAEELATLIAEHDVVLGLFGSSAKAASVIANKVWQGLAAGRTVITRQGAALAEIHGIVAEQLIVVPPADARALAAAIDRAAVQSRRAFPHAAEDLEDYVEREFETFGDVLLAGRRSTVRHEPTASPVPARASTA